MPVDAGGGSDPPCELLQWDSDFFGLTVGRVRGHVLDAAHAVAVDDWCAERKVDLLYLLAACDDRQTPHIAQRHNFVLTDLRVTFERAGAEIPAGAESLAALRLAMPEDLGALEAIARTSHTDSRFYYDERIPRSRADDLFATWIRNSLGGYAAAVLVCGPIGAPLGYVTCHLDSESAEGSIGLIAVGEQSRGHGIGKLLVNGAIRWMADHGRRAVSVVTQGRNISAGRLYERCGFLVRGLQLYYHKWFSRGRREAPAG